MFRKANWLHPEAVKFSIPPKSTLRHEYSEASVVHSWIPAYWLSETICCTLKAGLNRMPRRKKQIGICRICGQEGELSFEHIPPRAAFNNKRTIQLQFDEALALGPDEPVRGSVQQGGVGGYTLCPRCNNNSGKWYGPYFVDWCYQGMHLLNKTKGRPTLIYLHHLFPLA